MEQFPPSPSEEIGGTSSAVIRDEDPNPWPFLEAKFFEFQSSERSTTNSSFNLKFFCKLCTPSKTTIISCQSSSTANLKTHIKRKHPHEVKNFEDLCKLRAQTSKNTQQPITSFFSTPGSVPRNHLTQKQVDTMIARYIISSGLSFNHVRSPEFLQFMADLQPGRTVLCKPTLVKRLQEKFKEMKTHVTQEMGKVEHVCTTADMWSEAKKSFLGVTAHFLTPDLERMSFALACRRIQGRHTFDVLAQHLEEILSEYKILKKTEGMVTDNGSNFCKAFRIFGTALEVEPCQVGLQAQSLAQEATEQADEDGGEDLEFQEIDEILSPEENDQEALYHLPRHFRCASHTLNLIVTKDAEEALKVASYKRVSRSTFAKLQALWNKQERSSTFADLVKEKLGIYFIVPNVTRWNSTFQAMDRCKRFVCEQRNSFNRLLSELNLEHLPNPEVQFLNEYCSVMSPVAKSLDILQGEKHMFMGYLLPTIARLQTILDGKKEEIQLCQPLITAIKMGLKKRFDDSFTNKFLIVAACTLPCFKLE